MNEMMRQAMRLQRKLDQTKKEVKDKELSATAVGDKVKATVTYGGKVARLEVDPEFAKAEGIDLVLDAVTTALNIALEQAEKAMEAELEKASGGVKLPF